MERTLAIMFYISLVNLACLSDKAIDSFIAPILQQDTYICLAISLAFLFLSFDRFKEKYILVIQRMWASQTSIVVVEMNGCGFTNT